MNIQDNNKLIAEFMGLEKENGLYLFTTPMDDYKTDTLYFNTSWDWLMPVVDKCMQTGDNTDEWDTLYNALSTLNITNTYQAVVEFIKQYNNNSFKTSSELAQNC